MAKNQLQKAKLDQKKQWKKVNKQKKIQKQEKKREKKQNQQKKVKEKYQKTLDLVIVKNKNQQAMNWPLIFSGVKEKYKNFIAKTSYVDIDNDNIECSVLNIDTKDKERETKLKTELWNYINALDWQGKFRMILIQNIDDIEFDKKYILRLFQKKVCIVRIKNEFKEDDFDSKVQELNELQYNTFQDNKKQTIDQTFKEHLILKLNKKRKQEQQLKVKIWHGVLKKDQWFSNVNYLKVESIEDNNYKCVNKDKKEFVFQKNDLLEMQSAQQYQKQVGLTQLKLIEKFVNCRSQILKVVYFQKYTTDQLKKFIQEQQDLESAKKNEQWLKNIMQGRKLEVICNIQQNKIYLGKVSIKNLQTGTIQQIDVRSIQEIIFDQQRYYLKNENEQNNHSKVENEIKIGDWFANVNYYKVLDILDEKITVKDEKNNELQLKKSFLEKECLSADNFEKKKNMSLRDMVELLKVMQSQVFKIEYKITKNFKDSFKNFQNINQEIQKDSKKLRKLCKNICYNDTVTSVAKQLEIDETLSYSKIYDLDQQKVIEVDHRSIKTLIFKNMKYCKS